MVNLRATAGLHQLATAALIKSSIPPTIIPSKRKLNPPPKVVKAKTVKEILPKKQKLGIGELWLVKHGTTLRFALKTHLSSYKTKTNPKAVSDKKEIQEMLQFLDDLPFITSPDELISVVKGMIIGDIKEIIKDIPAHLTKVEPGDLSQSAAMGKERVKKEDKYQCKKSAKI